MYRLASIWAALAVPLWAAIAWFWPGASAWPDAARSIDWHARAMVSGFVGAVVVAFLIAPLRRWPADRSALAWMLLAAWLAARALSLAPVEAHAAAAAPGTAPLPVWMPPASLATIADLLFFGVAAVELGRRALRAPGPNNLLFAAAPLVLSLSVVAPLQVLEFVSILIAILAGRVAPGLVNTRLPSRPARIRVDLERIALGALLAAIALRAWLPGSAVADLAAAFAALAHLMRWWGWAPLAAMRADLRLATMLVAYAWLPTWLLIGATGDWAPAGAGTHPLAVGLVGGMTWAMMNRTLAGADQRPGWLERLGAAAILTAAPARVGLAFAPPDWQAALAAVSTICWSLAFLSLAARGLDWATIFRSPSEGNRQ